MSVAQPGTGCSHNTPSTLFGGLDAKKGNEDTAPSVLYVARLELYSRGAGSEPSVGGALLMFQDSNKEALDMKQAKSNTVITLVVLFCN